MAAEVIPEICGGRKTSCLALTEASAGAEAANIRLKAERKDDVFVLNGEKTSISMVYQTDLGIVFARTGTQEERTHGITAIRIGQESAAPSSRMSAPGSSGVVPLSSMTSKYWQRTWSVM